MISTLDHELGLGDTTGGPNAVSALLRARVQENDDRLIAEYRRWCHAPATPEDLDAEEKAAKKQATTEPDLFQKQGT